MNRNGWFGCLVHQMLLVSLYHLGLLERFFGTVSYLFLSVSFFGIIGKIICAYWFSLLELYVSSFMSTGMFLWN